jgi:hypothetical protein
MNEKTMRLAGMCEHARLAHFDRHEASYTPGSTSDVAQGETENG